MRRRGSLPDASPRDVSKCAGKAPLAPCGVSGPPLMSYILQKMPCPYISLISLAGRALAREHLRQVDGLPRVEPIVDLDVFGAVRAPGEAVALLE